MASIVSTDHHGRSVFRIIKGSPFPDEGPQAELYVTVQCRTWFPDGSLYVDTEYGGTDDNGWHNATTNDNVWSLVQLWERMPSLHRVKLQTYHGSVEYRILDHPSGGELR